MTLHQGRRYLLTGASAGLGFATAQVLAAQGASTVVSSRDASRVDRAVADLGPLATGFAGDLGDPHFATAAMAHGPFDGALISVGGPSAGRALALADEQWTHAYETIFLGSIRLIRTLCDGDHLTRGSAIALVLSTSARTNIPGLAISNGLRPGLAMLISDIADEIGPLGLRILGLLPGRFDTERVRTLDTASGDPAASRESFAKQIPLGRYGDPAEFGIVAAFMLSRDASYITGTSITIDGGMIRLP